MGPSMGFLFGYGLWVAALAIIVGYLVRFLREARRDPVTGRYRIDPTSFGPLSSYIERILPQHLLVMGHSVY